MTTCKRSCCWTPYKCARNQGCACHVDDPLDDYQHSPTNWDVITQDALRKQSRDEAKRMGEWAAWR